jgi:hypothetical protein
MWRGNPLLCVCFKTLFIIRHITTNICTTYLQLKRGRWGNDVGWFSCQQRLRVVDHKCVGLNTDYVKSTIAWIFRATSSSSAALQPDIDGHISPHLPAPICVYPFSLQPSTVSFLRLPSFFYRCLPLPLLHKREHVVTVCSIFQFLH